MKYLCNDPKLMRIRKSLRNNSTSAEAALWRYLKNSQLNGRKFRRQYGIGNYIVDFYCPRERLAIELDGNIHEYDSVNENDRNKSTFLRANNINILRVKNQHVFDNLESVLSTIEARFIKNTTPEQ